MCIEKIPVIKYSNIMNWTPEQDSFLTTHYPQKGLKWCCIGLQKTVNSVRNRASRLNLKQDKTSEFFKDWQFRAAASKVGKKRPEQALVIKKLQAEGKLKLTEERKKAVSINIKKWIAAHGHPKGALGMKHSDETKQKLSIKSKESWANMSEDRKAEKTLKMIKTKVAKGNLIPPRNASWKSGWREIGGIKKYYRSRWEANYARYLAWLKTNNHISDWLHEPKTFWFDGIKRGSVSYLPDFWVKENSGSESYHEVKGWMDSRSKTKLRRMAKYHPNVKIVLIDKAIYMSIAKDVKGFIPDWE